MPAPLTAVGCHQEFSHRLASLFWTYLQGKPKELTLSTPSAKIYPLSKLTRWVVDMVTDREQKGLQIAALRKIKKNSVGWLVPSPTSNGHTYKVDLEGQKCTCPDSRFRGQKCKHIFAVEYTIQRETITDGETTVTKTTETVKVTKVTYRQDWTAYNAAQTEEKSRFMELLADLCSNIPQPEQIGAGRPRLPMSDMVFASAYKVYLCFSSRRFTSDLRDAYAKGFVNSTPHFNSVNNYLADSDITPILGNLITISSLPLKSVEHDFAIDSSGFSTSPLSDGSTKSMARRLIIGSG